MNNGGCSQVCVDKPGTHECRCMKGYKLQADKKTCKGKTKPREIEDFYPLLSSIIEENKIQGYSKHLRPLERKKGKSLDLIYEYL